MKTNRKNIDSTILDTYLVARLGGPDRPLCDTTSTCLYGFDALMAWKDKMRCRAVVEALVHNAIFSDEPLHQVSIALLKTHASEPLVLAVVLYEITRCREMADLVQVHVLPLLGTEALQKAATIVGSIFAGQRPSMTDIYRECGVKDYTFYPPAEFVQHCCRIMLEKPPTWLQASIAIDILSMGQKLEELPRTRARLRQLAFEVGLTADDFRQAAPYMLENLVMMIAEDLPRASGNNPGRGYGICFDENTRGCEDHDHPLILAIAELLNEQWALASEARRKIARKVCFEHPSEYCFFLLPHLLEGGEEGVGQFVGKLQQTLLGKRGWIRERKHYSIDIDSKVLKRLEELYPQGVVTALEPLSVQVRAAFFNEVYDTCKKYQEKDGELTATIHRWIADEPHEFKAAIAGILTTNRCTLDFLVDVVLEPIGEELLVEIQDWLLSHSCGYQVSEDRVKVLVSFIVRHKLTAGPALISYQSILSELFEAGYVLQANDFPNENCLMSWLVNKTTTKHGNHSWETDPFIWGSVTRSNELLKLAAATGPNAAKAVIVARLGTLLYFGKPDESAHLTQSFIAMCQRCPILWDALYRTTGAQQVDRQPVSGRNSSFQNADGKVSNLATQLLAQNLTLLPYNLGRQLKNLFRQIALEDPPYRNSVDTSSLVQQFLSADQLRYLLLRRGPFYKARAEDRYVRLPAYTLWEQLFVEPKHKERLGNWLLSNTARTRDEDLIEWIEAFGFETDERFWPILENLVDAMHQPELVIALLRKVKSIPGTAALAAV